MSTTASPTPHGSPEPIVVRHIDVDLSKGFPIHWNQNDAYRSQLLNALSFMFPVGEQFFIDSVRHYAKEVQGKGMAKLGEDIKHFVGQEATHRHLHQQYNDYLVKLGYSDWVERALKRVMHMTRNFDPKSKLAATAAYEHYTAVLGDGLLRHRSWTEGMHPTMKRLWTWHAAEESEHKAVAIDTYRAAGGGYLRRVGFYTIISIEFFIYASVQTSLMLNKDGELFKLKTWASALKFWFGHEGIFWHTMPHWLAYYKPNFHPWQHDNRDLLARWQHDNAGTYRSVNTPQPQRHPA